MFRRSRLVMALAMLLSFAVAAPLARADDGLSVRDLVDVVMQNPLERLGGDCASEPGGCDGMGPTTLGLLMGTSAAPGVAVRAGAAKWVGSKCAGNWSTCISMGLASLAAVFGLVDMADDAVLDLWPESNPDFEPVTWGDFPEGAVVGPGNANPHGTFVLSHAEQLSNTQFLVWFDVTVTKWSFEWGSNSFSTLGVSMDYQCRDSNGNYTQVYYTGHAKSFTAGDPGMGGTKTWGLYGDHPACNSAYGGGPNYIRLYGHSDGLDVSYTWGAEGVPAGEIPASPLEDGSTGGARLECKDDLGSSYFVEVSAPAGSWNVPAPKCLTGDVPTGLEVGEVTPSGLDVHTGYELTPENVGPNLDLYPDCADGVCTWSVRINGVPCTIGQAGCVRWTENSSAQCWYGPYQMDRRLCAPMERYYEVQAPSVPVYGPNPGPGSAPGSTPNTDGDPTTSDGPQPEPEFPSSGGGPGPGTGTPGPLPASCVSSSYPGLGSVTAEAVALADEVGSTFGITDIGGYRASDPYPDHPSGRALDIMTYADMAKGQQVATYVQHNAVRLNVDYIIWNQQIWSVERADEGWRDMSDRGSDTANHKDHVHVTVYDRGSVDCTGSGVSDLECFANGWSWNPVSWVYVPVTCALKAMFVPDPTVVDVQLAKIRTAWASHPPGSVISALQPTLQSLGSGLASGECSGLPSFTPPSSGTEVSLPCEPPSGNPWASIYLLGQTGIVVATLISLWSMTAAALSARATGV